MNRDFMGSPLTASVLEYAKTLAGRTEQQLTAALPDGPTEGEAWYGYVE